MLIIGQQAGQYSSEMQCGYTQHTSMEGPHPIKRLPLLEQEDRWSSSPLKMKTGLKVNRWNPEMNICFNQEKKVKKNKTKQTSKQPQQPLIQLGAWGIGFWDRSNMVLHRLCQTLKIRVIILNLQCTNMHQLENLKEWCIGLPSHSPNPECFFVLRVGFPLSGTPFRFSHNER